jgi:hypothetical protein
MSPLYLSEDDCVVCSNNTEWGFMKKIALIMAICLALAGCAGSSKKSAQDKPQLPEAKPVESLFATKDMNDCEQQLGLAPTKTAADAYALSVDSLENVKTCALGLEKQRMPLLADLMDQYVAMLKQGDQECSKDIGTAYGDACQRNSHKDAADWYNRAVSQRLSSELPNQPHKPNLN